MLVQLCLACGCMAVASAANKPHIILVVSDDLGYNDLGYKNGNKTITPNIDAQVSGFVAHG